ncbi:MAG: hypothetical protein GYA23_12900, partial [Methanomicrobiales archaeon]|nr:hypothetical protein [Methanomicrobiales archaeon]
WTPDRIRIRYINRSSADRIWDFSLYKQGRELVHGGLGPDTGTLLWYAIDVPRTGRQESPSVSKDSAQVAAVSEIHERNSGVSVDLVEARYDELGMPGSRIAGVYVFLYHANGESPALCGNDGFTVIVDSVSGKVIEYRLTGRDPADRGC